jgi:nitrogen regulatory protein P-II 1
MKLVVAVLNPSRLDEVKSALQAHGVPGMTVSSVHGFGRQRGHTEVYRGREYLVQVLPKVRVEIVVEDDEAAGVVDVIVGAGKTGNIGDGKVWTLPVLEVLRIRTGQRGHEAL